MHCSRQAFVGGGVLFALLTCVPGIAQRGDRADESGQIQQAPTFPIPPAPALSPEDALRTIRVAPGFRVELIASEPLVEDPVAMAFGADGRLWVVEMRGWMNDVDGAGNDQPIGKVVVLEDRDGDGRMDHRTVFLDGLIMPRAVQVARDGAIIGAPPYLWFCRDHDGDGHADEKVEIASDYLNFPNPQFNPEADPNGLLWNLDNWLYSARYTARFRYRSGAWMRERAVILGQWGLTQDDAGRHFFGTNQDQLRANALPTHYASRNSNLLRPDGWDQQVATDQRVWPIRVTPGANRAYRPGVLRSDGTLRTFEAVSGMVIYRGGLFPAEFQGNAFVPDPVAHIVKRNVVHEAQGVLTAAQSYRAHEFLASTDERFRPVNLYNGPDGALYIVDMYRGIIEYRHVMTTFLRKQILERGLDQPLGLGRIYRVVPEGHVPKPFVRLDRMSGLELVALLDDPNAWKRETAQRLLVERGDLAVVPRLREHARRSPDARGRLHAFWTLEGLEAIDEELVLAALRDPSERVRAVAIRTSEPWLRAGADSAVSRAVLDWRDDPASEVALQRVLSLGTLPYPQREDALFAECVTPSGHPAAAPHPYFAGAIVSGLPTRELEFLERLWSDRSIETRAEDLQSVLRTLAAAVFQEAKMSRVERLFAMIAEHRPAATRAQLALLAGLDSVPRKQLSAAPQAIAAWQTINNPQVRAAALRFAAGLRWPGRDASPKIARLTPDEQRLVERGRAEYAVCSGCHLPNGQGMAGLAPPLVDSPFVHGAPEILARIILHGKQALSNYSPMPGLSVLGDEQIAAILSYIRRSWGHRASAVAPELIARVREEEEGRMSPWTGPELERLQSN